MKNFSSPENKPRLNAAYGPGKPHPVPTDLVVEAIDALDAAAYLLSKAVDTAVPESREKASALTLLDAAISLAKEGVRRHVRGGSYVNGGVLADLEAMTRIITKNPEKFPGLDAKEVAEACKQIRTQLEADPTATKKLTS